jgi:hypothetical protein
MSWPQAAEYNPITNKKKPNRRLLLPRRPSTNHILTTIVGSLLEEKTVMKEKLERLTPPEKKKMIRPTPIPVVLLDTCPPKEWKTATGVVILKPGKTDYQLPKAYRVIALQNCLGKVIEKVVATRVRQSVKGGNYYTMANSGAEREGQR